MDSPNLSAAVLAEVRAEMARRNLTKAELATRLGVPYHWLAERLNGRIRLSVDDLGSLAKALDLDPALLLGDGVPA